jgi:hypothetical protein
MRTQTMRAQAPDEHALEELEAEFLSTPIGLWPSQSGAGLAAAELLEVTGPGLAEPDQMYRTLYRTRPGGRCCD